MRETSKKETSKKRKYSAEVLTEMATVPRPPDVPDILSHVAPVPLLAPQGKQETSPLIAAYNLPGITVTALSLEELDHQSETLQVRLLGSYSGFSLTSSYSGDPSPV